MHKRFALVLVLLIALPGGSTAAASPIGAERFFSPTIQDFAGLGMPLFLNTGPLVLGGVTYQVGPNANGDRNYRYYDWESLAGPVTFGEGIATDSEYGYFDVIFPGPVVRAGGWVGFSYGPVAFFDSSDSLLGIVDLGLSGPNAARMFAGWEDPAGIGRIRFSDASDNGQILALDGVRYDGVGQPPIPEPASMLLFGTGLAGLRAWRKRGR